MKRLLIILPLLFWISCDEDAEDTLPTELVGTWYLSNDEVYMEMTTNSDQTMIDQSGPGIGSIAVEGAVNTSLTYMIFDEFDGWVSIMVASQSLYGPINFPFYYLMFDSYGGNASANFVAADSFYYETYYFTDSLDFSYDLDSYTFTIGSTEFYETNMFGVVDSSLSVTLSGTIQANTIAIPANTPTLVDQSDYFAMPEMTITLEADGSIVRTETFVYYEEPETETYEGTWSVSGDQLIILEEYEGNGETEIDTVEFTFSLSGNTLTLIMEEDLCEPDEDYPMDECLEEGSMALGLDPGSLTDLVMVQIINFSNTPPTLARAASKSILKHLLQRKNSDRSHVLYNPFQGNK